jgi:hypothetical protein
LWRRTIPAFYTPTLDLDRAAGTWRVAMHEDQTGGVVTVAGTVNGENITTTRLSGAQLAGRPLHTYRDGSSLVTTMPTSMLGPRMFLVALGFAPFRWDVWRVVASGARTRVATLPGFPECDVANERDETLLCIVRGQSGATLWRLARGGMSTTSLGLLPASVDYWRIGGRGRVASVTRDGSILSVVDATSGRGTRVTLRGGVQLQSASPQSVSYTRDVDVADGIVGVLTVTDGTSEVTLYRIR